MPDAPRLAWFPFYWQDFLGSDKVQSMTDEEVGLYLKLLLLQWDKGSVPAEIKHLDGIRYLKSNNAETVAKLLSLCFVKRNNCYVNLKLAKIRKEKLKRYQELCDAGSKGGKTKRLKENSEAQAKHLLSRSSSELSEEIRREENRKEKIRFLSEEDVREEERRLREADLRVSHSRVADGGKAKVNGFGFAHVSEAFPRILKGDV